MVKVDMQMALKYLGLGAGAVAIPALIGNVAGINSFLVGIPLWTQTIGVDAITAGGIVLAGLGVGLVDQLFFGK